MLVTAGIGWDDDARAEALTDGLRLLTASLLTGAGLLCLVRWRMTGITRPAFLGVGLVVLGVFAESLRNVAPIVYGEAGLPLPRQLTTAAASVAALWLFVWARRAPAIDAGARPGRVLAGVALTVPLACTAFIAWAAPLSVGAQALPVAVPGVLLVALWSWATLREHRAGLDGRSPWLVLVFGCLAAAAGLDVAAAFQAQPAGTWVAVLLLAAGVVALHGSFVDVLTSLSAQSSDLLRLTVDVHDRQAKERTVEAREQERLHEVRNVLAGLHGATATLRKYEDRLDPGVRRRLEDAVSAELRRLAHIVDPQAAPPTTSVDLETAVLPVVEAERHLGAEVDVDLAGLCVRGRLGDVATAMSALLVNARRHAPGSPVEVRAEAGAGEVRVYVEDRGPGVPLDQREVVFERGERAAATAAGSGLGLYTARRLAVELGGSLRVDERAGGGASFVLTLPSAAGATEGAGQRRPQAGEVDDRAAGTVVPVAPEGDDDVGVDLSLASG
jgi:signal transduction histidine kinase